MKVKSLVPNALTMANLLGGVYVCWVAVSTTALERPLAGGVVAAVWLGAMLCDGLDGWVARRMEVDGLLGTQLDSLADLVTGGLASACVAYNILYNSGARESFTLLVPLLIIVAAAYRLARYNVAAMSVQGETESLEEPYFVGLPVPAVGLFWMGLMMWRGTMEGVDPQDLEQNEIFAAAAVVGVGLVVLPLLMVMTKRVYSLKYWGMDFMADRVRIGIGLGCLGVFAGTWFAWGNVYAAVPLCVLLYSGVSFVMAPK